MDKKNGLKSNAEFAKVYKNGKNYWNRNLILYVMKNDLNYSRIGFSVTKKIGNSVIRNKTKRRMKEICRQNFDTIRSGYDIIMIPKKNVVDITYKELKSAIFHIFKLANIRNVKDTGGK